MLVRAELGLRSIFNPVEARYDAIDQAREGNLDLNYLVRRWGIDALLELRGFHSAEFFAMRSHDDAFRDLVLSDLGIKATAHRNVPTVEPSPRVVGWIGLIHRALSLEHLSRPGHLTGEDWRRTQYFFGRLTYPEATNELLELLNSDIRLPHNVLDPSTKPISERVVGTQSKTTTTALRIPGGWHDISALFVDKYLVERIEQVYLAYKPVAEGADAALMQIARNNPSLKTRIFTMVLSARSWNPLCSVYVEGKEIKGSRNPLNNYYADYYTD